MKLYVQKPGGWTSTNPNGVYMEMARKVSPKGKVTEYEVFYRVVPDVPINVDTKHRQPVNPATVRTGMRIRKENWEAPGPHVMGHGSIHSLRENHFTCLDCKRKLPSHLESQTLSARDFEYARKEHGIVQRDAVLFSESKVKGMIPYRNKASWTNVCTKCANRRIKGAPALSLRVPCAIPHCDILAKQAEHGPSVCAMHLNEATTKAVKMLNYKFTPPVYAPRPKPLVEQFGMIVSGRHGGSKLKIGGQNVIRVEDIELYNLAILSKKKSASALKPKIHRAA